MPRPTRLPPRLPPHVAACPAPSSPSRAIRRCILARPHPGPRGGTRAFCTRRGKSRGHAETCGEPVTLKLVPTLPPPVTTGDRGRGAPSAGQPLPWLLGQAGRQARTHARRQARTPAGVPPASQQPGHVGRGAGSRARAARRVRERAQPRVVRRAGARPSRTEKPARPPPRRSLGKQRGPAPVGCSGLSPSRREPPGRRLQLHPSRDRCK